MLNRATMQVLAEAAEIGLAETATIPAAAFDPLLRPAIKKRVERAVVAATAKVRPNAPGEHLLRVAFLLAAGAEPSDPNDDRAVEKAFFERAEPFLPKRPAEPANPGGAYRAGPTRDPLASVVEPPKRRKHFWPLTTALIAFVLLVSFGTSAIFLVPLLLPTELEKFRKTPFGIAAGEPLTDLIVRGEKLDADTREKLLSSPVEKQVGTEGFKNLEHIVQMTPKIGASTAATTDEAMKPLFENVNALNEHLRQQKVPAMLHAYGQGQPGARNVWLTSYFVDHRDEVKVGTIDCKIAWGRRLDHLNLLDSIIYKASGEDWAILSSVLLEQDFVETLLSPIAKDTPMGPTEYRDDDKSKDAELARVAGRVVSAEILAQTKVAKSDAIELHRQLARRNELVVSLARIGYNVKPSSALELSPASIKSMTESAVRHPEDRQLLQDYLKLSDRTAASRRLIMQALVVLGEIEEEEFIVRVDSEPRYAKSELPTLTELSPRGRAIAASELALLARKQACPKLALWRAAQHAIGTEKDVATYTALGQMLEQLGLLKMADEDRYLEKFDAALAAAMELPTDRVQAAAEATYRKLFGDAPQPLVRTRL